MFCICECVRHEQGKCGRCSRVCKHTQPPLYLQSTIYMANTTPDKAVNTINSWAFIQGNSETLHWKLLIKTWGDSHSLTWHIYRDQIFNCVIFETFMLNLFFFLFGLIVFRVILRAGAALVRPSDDSPIFWYFVSSSISWLHITYKTYNRSQSNKLCTL